MALQVQREEEKRMRYLEHKRQERITKEEEEHRRLRRIMKELEEAKIGRTYDFLQAPNSLIKCTERNK